MISRNEFDTLTQAIGIEKGGADYELFASYCEELKDWNSRVNLTAIKDDEGIAVKHFADSLLPLTLFPLPAGCSLIDVGTGAGFPSIPMKLVRGDISLTLLDSLEKRLVFLRHLCAKLGIAAETVHLRAEDAGKNPLYREKYDIATARAVASLSALAEYCLPLVKVGGAVLALKGSGGREEAEQAQNAVKLCGGEIEQVLDYNLPNSDPRTLVILRKKAPTPPKYPRNAAQSAKNPL
ncbi:MAG: 16S rRNA (guanine(527)-N(7))-methyltransferase RsmG [Angelakisella sp.]